MTPTGDVLFTGGHVLAQRCLSDPGSGVPSIKFQDGFKEHHLIGEDSYTFTFQLLYHSLNVSENTSALKWLNDRSIWSVFQVRQNSARGWSGLDPPPLLRPAPCQPTGGPVPSPTLLPTYN